MLLTIVAGLLAPATIDSIRDIYQANSIASGHQFPLQGPQMAHSVHLGPIWFYILAIPASVSSSWTAIAVFVYFLSGLKFYLAWYFGRMVHSSQFGFLFALMLALPGWSSVQLIYWTHTNVLETALLLFLILFQSSLLNPAPIRWLFSGIGFGLALHAHPTALPFVAVLALAWKTIRNQPALLLLWTLGAGIPFIPSGIHQLVEGFPALLALKGYHQSEFTPGGLKDVLKLIYSVVISGPRLAYETALSQNLALIAVVLHWSLLASMLVTVLARIKQTDAALLKMMVVGVLGLILVASVVVWMRARTTFWMAYAPGFMLAYCYAVLAAASRPSKKIRQYLIAPVLIVLAGATLVGTAIRLNDSSLRVQGAVLFDVKNLSGTWGPGGLEFSSLYAGAHGRFLCQQSPLVLHGPYSALVDSHVGIEAEMYCGRREEIFLGGGGELPEDRHWVGVSNPMRLALGFPPVHEVGNVYFYRPLKVADSTRTLTLPEGDTNPPRRGISDGSDSLQRIQLSSEETSALLVSKPVGIYSHLEILHVTCNEEPAERLVSSNYAWLFGCAHGKVSSKSTWELEYKASAAGMVDAVLLATARSDP
jgi:hypothetical protein